MMAGIGGQVKNGEPVLPAPRNVFIGFVVKPQQASSMFSTAVYSLVLALLPSRPWPSPLP